MQVTIPDHLVPLAQQLAAVHLTECQHQARLLERTFGAGHPNTCRAAELQREALDYRLLFPIATRAAA